jgi:hypothetical protein
MFAFNKTSMAGTGVYIMTIACVSRLLGIDLDDQKITELAEASMLVFGFIMTVIGQVLRSDLKWGIVRRKPLDE